MSIIIVEADRPDDNEWKEDMNLPPQERVLGSGPQDYVVCDDYQLHKKSECYWSDTDEEYKWIKRGPDWKAMDNIGKDNVVLKDSGERREFSTGAVRDKTGGKGRYDLLQCRAIHLVARQLEEGAKKYSDRNWEKGLSLSCFMDSGLRHIFNYMRGLTDEDHLVAAAWNIMSALETRERIREGLLGKELDDIAPMEKPDES